MTEYREHRTHVPPVLALENGELVIKLMFGDQTYVAGVGDGQHFFSQVIDKLVDPALRAAYPRVETYPTGWVSRIDGSPATQEETERVQKSHAADLAKAFASPND